MTTAMLPRRAAFVGLPVGQLVGDDGDAADVPAPTRPGILARLIGGHRPLPGYWDSFRRAMGIEPGSAEDAQCQLCWLLGQADLGYEIHKTPSFEELPEVVDALEGEGVKQLDALIGRVMPGIPAEIRGAAARKFFVDPSAAVRIASGGGGTSESAEAEFTDEEGEGECEGDADEDPDLAGLDREVLALERSRAGAVTHSATTADAEADSAALELLLATP